jgi:hypothetical protein
MRHTIREREVQFEETTLPKGLLLPRHAAIPDLHIKIIRAGILDGFGGESERMVLSPLLSVLIY